MAVNIVVATSIDAEGTILGTQFCDSPVIVRMDVGESTFSSSVTARKAQLRIVARHDSETEPFPMGDDYESFEFSVENGESYDIDISSALRALIGESSFNPQDDLTGDSYESTVIEYALYAGYSYMENGVLYDSFSYDNVNGVKGGMFAIRGALSEMERYRLGNNGVTQSKELSLTRKPSGGEISVIGAMHTSTTIAKATSMETGGVVTYTQGAPTTITTEVSNDNAGQLGVFIDNVHSNQYKQFCFINTLGVPETVCARTLESSSYSIEPTSYTRLEKVRRVPKLNRQIYTHQPETYKVYEMSSGAVTREWAEWWTTEFLRASAWWMLNDGVWWPVSVSPSKKEVSVYDKSKDDALSVAFTVTMGLTGTSTNQLF